MMKRFDLREASHAGSWYSGDGSVLKKQLKGWIDNARKEQQVRGGILKAIIAPHAGYAYSGPTAGFAYSQIDGSKYKRVFLLGPSHHYYLENCALSAARMYETPLGNIDIDQETVDELHASGNFSIMKKSQDEEEHSLEMHLPYIKHAFDSAGNSNFKLVPILVGNLNSQSERSYGEFLSKYVTDDQSLFVISSDFCHWGKRFQYVYYREEEGEIHESIEKLDKTGMQLIEKKDFPAFKTYLSNTQNTICGRHPIAVLLGAINKLESDSKKRFEVKFVKYAQSEPVKTMSQSSVSYASAVAFEA